MCERGCNPHSGSGAANIRDSRRSIDTLPFVLRLLPRLRHPDRVPSTDSNRYASALFKIHNVWDYDNVLTHTIVFLEDVPLSGSDNADSTSRRQSVYCGNNNLISRPPFSLHYIHRTYQKLMRAIRNHTHLTATPRTRSNLHPNLPMCSHTQPRHFFLPEMLIAALILLIFTLCFSLLNPKPHASAKVTKKVHFTYSESIETSPSNAPTELPCRPATKSNPTTASVKDFEASWLRPSCSRLHRCPTSTWWRCAVHRLHESDCDICQLCENGYQHMEG